MISLVTTDFDVHIRECAEDMNDNIIMRKLSAGGMFAQGAVYHLKYLTLFMEELINVGGTHR